MGNLNYIVIYYIITIINYVFMTLEQKAECR